MGEYEDILEQLREESISGEEAAERLEKFSATTLRKKAGERDSFEQRNKELEEELASLKAAPKRREAFEKYGIDFDALRPAEKRMLEQYDGELTDEAIAELVEQNELPTTESEEGEEEEESPAEKITAAARRGASGSRVPKVTPEEVAEWPADKWVRFADANPDAAEALRRGEQVTGVTG